jgi:soluble lytic murein transglycosylase-like protein
MPNLIKNPICGGLNPLIPEQGIVMSFRYLAYLNDLYGNNGYFVDANVFAMYNGGPNIFTSTKVTPERKQAAVNYGNKIANGN